MKKSIQIKILPDGKIQAITQGVKGKACLDYLPLLEEMLEAQAIDSEFTAEYYETENEVETYQPQNLNQNF